MAGPRAIIIGAGAALALPYVMRNDPEALGGWVHRGVVHFSLSNYHFAWSWPIFCLITLLAWACFSWAER